MNIPWPRGGKKKGWGFVFRRISCAGVCRRIAGAALPSVCRPVSQMRTRLPRRPLDRRRRLGRAGANRPQTAEWAGWSSSRSVPCEQLGPAGRPHHHRRGGRVSRDGRCPRTAACWTGPASWAASTPVPRRLGGQYEAFVQRCPTSKVVLAGYSQGAMVVHRNLHALAGSPNLAAALLDRRRRPAARGPDPQPGHGQRHSGAREGRRTGLAHPRACACPAAAGHRRPDDQRVRPR